MQVVLSYNIYLINRRNIMIIDITKENLLDWEGCIRKLAVFTGTQLKLTGWPAVAAEAYLKVMHKNRPTEKLVVDYKGLEATFPDFDKTKIDKIMQGKERKSWLTTPRKEASIKNEKTLEFLANELTEVHTMPHGTTGVTYNYTKIILDLALKKSVVVPRQSLVDAKKEKAYTIKYGGQKTYLWKLKAAILELEEHEAKELVQELYDYYFNEPTDSEDLEQDL